MSTEESRLEDFTGFDHNVDGHRRDAECTWARMRATPGLPNSTAHGGFFVATRYADVSVAARTPEVYSSAQGIAIPDLHLGARLLPLETDPPLQTEYRRLLVPFLTRERIGRREGAIREIARALLRDFAGRTELDFVEAFAKPFPARVALDFFGFPSEDLLQLDQWINESIGGRGSEAAKLAGAQLSEYIDRALARHRAVPLDPENIVSTIAHAAIQGRALTPTEQNSVTKLLLFGGFTTTLLVLSAAIRWLAEHPEDRKRLRETPELLETAVDEFVRYASPGTYLGRTVVAEAQLSGTALQPGDRLLMCYGSANRDAAVFPEPDRVVLDRAPNRHMGFGHGTHSCMGLHLGRLELRVALQEVLSRMIDFEVSDPEGIEWMGGETQGISRLPIRILRFV